MTGMLMRDVIVAGASAGGVEALAELVHGLPADLAAAIFVVLHLPPEAKSHLPGILDRAGPLPAIHASDEAQILPGRIYVAPPNCHLMLEGDRMRLSIGPRINSLRPSIDVLFRSAARSFGPRAIGVVLSGTLDDGTLGLDAIKLGGGVVVIQDPDEARFSGMPRSAIERVTPDYVMPVAQIAGLLARLTSGSTGESPMAERSDVVEYKTSSGSGVDAAARFAQSPRVRQTYLEQAEMVEGQAIMLRDGLARVIQSESSNSVLLPDPVAALDPEPMEGGPS